MTDKAAQAALVGRGSSRRQHDVNKNNAKDLRLSGLIGREIIGPTRGVRGIITGLNEDNMMVFNEDDMMVFYTG